MQVPPTQGLAIVQDPFTLTWHAKGHVESVGWLQAQGKSLLEALRRLAAGRVAEQHDGAPDAPLARPPCWPSKDVVV